MFKKIPVVLSLCLGLLKPKSSDVSSFERLGGSWMVFFLFYFMNCFDLSLSVADVSEFWPCQLKVNLVCIFYEFMFYKFYITRTCFIGNAYFDILVGFFRIFTRMSVASDLI